MKRKFINIIFCIVLICITFRGCENTSPDNIYNNTVTTLNVGQASCAFIESDGAYRMFDRGGYGGTDIVSYLNGRGVEKLDLLVISHFHADHINNALDVIRNFEIETVLIPALTPENIPDTYFYKSLLEDDLNGYFKLEYAYSDMVFNVGGSEIKVLADTINHKGENNTSIALSRTIAGNQWVYLADLESDCDSLILDSLPENIRLFTAAHHGSSDSNSESMLAKLRPEFMVISCGKDNDYGHPHPSFVARAENLGIPYAITYENGNIVYNMETARIFTD